jgi:flagellar FliL protein
MAKEEEAKDEAEAKGGGKKKLIIIIVPIVLLLAGAGWFFFLKPKDDSGVPEALPEPTPGAVVTLDSITVNLAGAHFLKFGMALQPTATAKEVDGSEALDLAINQFSQMTLEELSTAKGRREAKEELVARIKLTYLPHGTVLSEVTSTAATAEEQSQDEEKAVEENAKKETATESEKKELHVEDMTAAEAIKRAASLTVQADIYDLYFTEFVMQ